MIRFKWDPSLLAIWQGCKTLIRDAIVKDFTIIAIELAIAYSG